MLLSGLNLMQSHLFNVTRREHLQVWGGGGEGEPTQKGETLPVRLDRFNVLATGVSERIDRRGEIRPFVEGTWEQRA